ncbi:hypothetical protein L9F63_021148 [Diploptera punctata]|uniref:Uncharacterized protein n=1 Tax=Diploptera punctata TaxID=6984 RepID=A0AAD7ZPY1_DIPPU|nr:hypothetical protein L9F63_021148 [Diploptera punctata]
MVQTSPVIETTTTEPDNSTTIENHQINSEEDSENPTSNMKLPELILVPLENIIFGLDPNTIVQFTNLQMSIPSDLRLEDNPDFSRMILGINSMIGNVEVKGDYSISVYGYTMVPISSQGNIHIKLQNVSVVGETALALTPAALLALSYSFMYKPTSVNVEIVPTYNDMITQEERLSNEILKDPIITLIKKQIDYHLNYYTESKINMILSRISVFTVGHKKEVSFIKEPFNQNVQIDEINISSFHRNFSEKLESSYVSGNFSAEEGWVSGISSLKRFSNVSLSKKGDVFVLSAGVNFSKLEMGYDRYKALFMDTQVSGEMDGIFLQTKMIFKVSLNPNSDGTCQSNLSELRAYKMNGYRIKNISNIGSLDWLQRRINNWLIGYFQIKIVKEIEKELSEAVHTSLNRFDCGDYLPHLKVIA